MSKNNDQLSNFLTQSTPHQFRESFEIAMPTGFDGMFGNAKLTDKEKENIQIILKDNISEDGSNLENMHHHFNELVDITSQLKQINNESILLHGERIKKAQEILLNYKHGAFTEWLMLVYNNRQTPYNMLKFYELYQEIENPQRQIQVKSMPRKAAYLLASRNGDIDIKCEIIERYHESEQKEVMEVIDQFLPIQKRRKKNSKDVTGVLIQMLGKKSHDLKKRKDILTDSHKKKLEKIIENLTALL